MFVSEAMSFSPHHSGNAGGSVCCHARFVDPWDMRSSGMSIDEAPPALVRAYYESGVWSRRIGHVFTDTRSALQNIGLARGGFLTNAGALLFCPADRPVITCRAYDAPSCSVLVDSSECCGPLGASIQAALRFLGAHDVFSFDASPYDAAWARALCDACSELLLNAVMHRAYDIDAPIQIVAYPRAIHITNPGEIPWSVLADLSCGSAEQAVSQPYGAIWPAFDRAASYRNSLLVQALYRFGIVRASGRGLLRALAACARCGLELSVDNAEGAAVVAIQAYPADRP